MASVDELRRETADAVRRLSEAFTAEPAGQGTNRDEVPPRGVGISSVSAAVPLGDANTRLLSQSLDSVSRSVNQFNSAVTTSTQALERSNDGGGVDLGRLVRGLRPDSGGGGLLGFLGGGLGTGALVRAIAGAFNGERDEPRQFETTSLPPSISLELDNSRILPGLARVRRGQDGLPRTVEDDSAATTQVVVQVNAMDSQSFMDRSSDIARAVRDAMLNMHPVNDMINEV